MVNFHPIVIVAFFFIMIKYNAFCFIIIIFFPAWAKNSSCQESVPLKFRILKLNLNHLRVGWSNLVILNSYSFYILISDYRNRYNFRDEKIQWAREWTPLPIPSCHFAEFWKPVIIFYFWYWFCVEDICPLYKNITNIKFF